MIQTMEKFINFKQLDVVKTGTSTSDGSSALTLTDSAATFTQDVLVNAIVWDRTTGASVGGQKYLVTAVTDTVLTLVAVGVTADQGTGVPNAVGYFIYMPEYTVLQFGMATSTIPKYLVDSSVNFILAGVSVGDYVRDITGSFVTTVTSVSKYQLGVADTVFSVNDNYLVYKEGANDFDRMVRSANVADVSNSSTSSAIVNITYDTAGTDVGRIDYAYSSTIGANADMRGAIQDAIVSSLETEWYQVSTDFSGLLNPANSVSNATWLGGRDYFILRIQ
jgi:hypothetical protein|tara:strand:+ start:796 stop:1629 length:834 start_codon:yes stop_codon:yes gene_type:complete